MKIGMMKKISVIFLLILCMLPMLACDRGAVLEQARFHVDLSYGYGSGIEIGSYAPFFVEVTNNGKDFEGSIQMIVPGRDNNNIMYEKELSLPKGATKTVELVGFITMPTRQVNIRILNERGKVIWSDLKDCPTNTSLKYVNIGILSDDYSALGYMDQQFFMANNELTTRITELSRDSFSSDWRALDILDVIVISDFSTDMLSDAQLNALALWVNDGGLLMVGTGSTANKTLSALNGNLFDVKVGDLQSYQTKYGLSITGFDYSYNTQYYNNAYDNSEYSDFFTENYDSLREALVEEYMSEFEEEYGYDNQYHVWDDEWESNFYWYCYEKFYETYLYVYGNEASVHSRIDALPYADASVLELEDNTMSYAEGTLFYGEDANGELYELAYAIKQGDGYILLSGIDFTKTPFSNYGGNSLIFVHWIESLMGERYFQEMNSYTEYQHYYYNPFDIDYNDESIFDSTKTATVPPSLLYIGLLCLYMLAVLVLYIVLRNRRKTMRLWIVYPCMAVGVAILIFCFGFSTRIYRPVLTAVTLMTPNGSTITQQSYVGVTVPGNKEYQVGFDSNQAVEYVDADYRYSYSDSAEIDWDKYTMGYKYGYDSVDVMLGTKKAMGQVNFRLTAVSADTRTVLLESDSGAICDLVITNRFGCDLENAAVVLNGQVYIIGEIKAGESVAFASLQPEKIQNLGPIGFGGIVMEEEMYKTVLGFLFGSVSTTYDEYLCKLRAYNGLTEKVQSYVYNKDTLLFVAIPKEHFAQDMQSSTNYNEKRVEVIFMSYCEPQYSWFEDFNEK